MSRALILATVSLVTFGQWANAQQQIDTSQCGVSILCAEVNKERQEIYIHIPGEGIYTDKVSTGGGWKRPKNGAAPYCADAETPNVSKWIPATPDNMGELRYSGEFSTENEKVPMPFYIWVQNGIFLHQVPGDKYVKYLGQNVSAGCIRLSKTTAPKLYDRMQQHGGLYLTIYGKNPDGDNACRDTNKPVEIVASGVRQSQEDGYLFGPAEGDLGQNDGDSSLPPAPGSHKSGFGQGVKNFFNGVGSGFKEHARRQSEEQNRRLREQDQR